MKKNLLAVAVTSALAGVAIAQADTVNVNVYGKLYPEFAIAGGNGASDPAAPRSTLIRASSGENPKSTQFVNSSNSYIGFKGDADIGGGMKGWFQVEQVTDVDVGVSTWASRNSGVGLTGGFGNVFLGRWDTVYKDIGGPVSFLGLSSGNFVSNSSMLSRTGLGSSRASRFHERANNWVQYDTPEFGGFQAKIGYSPDEGKTADTNATITSYGAKWEAGPLYVALAHEVHNDFFSLTQSTARVTGVGNGTSVTNGLAAPFDARATVIDPGLQSKDQATRLSVAYTLGDTKIGFEVSELDYKESGAVRATGITNYKHKTGAITVAQKLGNTDLVAEYTKAQKGTCTRNGGAVCDTQGLDGQQISLGALFNLSKRLGLFVLATQVKNGDSAAYNPTDVAIQPGTDPHEYGAGIVFKF